MQYDLICIFLYRYLHHPAFRYVACVVIILQVLLLLFSELIFSVKYTVDENLFSIFVVWINCLLKKKLRMADGSGKFLRLFS